MKKLLITLEYPPQVGGVGNYLSDLANEYPVEDLVVLAPENKSQEAKEFDQERKYKIYRKKFLTRLIWPYWLPLLFAAKKIVQKEKIESIEVGQVLPIGIIALYLKKRFKIPFRLYTYGMDVTFAQKSERKNKLFKKIIKQAEEIITISEYTKKKLLAAEADQDKIKIIEPRAHVIPTKYDISEEEAVAFERKYSLEGKKIILTVGRLTKRKGQDMVIQSLSSVLEEVKNAVYLIVGKGEDKARLEKLVKENKLENKVVFAGEISKKDLAITYTLCHVFVMVAREENGDFEGYGIVYQEAQSFNKPVIAGRSGGAVEAVGENGILVDPKNKEEIARAIISYLK